VSTFVTSHEKFEWRIGSEPPLIETHSLAKHRVLKSYLQTYVSVLTVNRAQEVLRLSLIDGFAGGGLYLDARTKEERPGSPLIMLDAMKEAEAAAQTVRSKPFALDVHYFFIEKNADSLGYLRRTIAESEFRGLLDDKIHLIQAEFVETVPQIVGFVKARGRAGRAIFSLDQYGYSDVPFPTLRGILASLENAEVILTFATDWLIDYLGENEQTQQILANLGIHLPPKTIATAKGQAKWRRIIQIELHKEIQERSGARFYTPFFIRSSEAHRDYWLVHLSGHFRARDVMVGLHWKENRSFAHYGRPGLRMLGYDSQFDEDWNKQKLLGFFFDDTALALSQGELMEQLPERLASLKEGVEFSEFFAQVTNEVPVTQKIMAGVFRELAREGLIEIRDSTGLTARRSGIPRSSDIILVSGQKRLFT
jgi:three-Cys-motif partner protein